jgi:hypothetical protein
MRVLVPIWLALLVSIFLAPWYVKLHLRTAGVRHDAGHFWVFLVTALLLSADASRLYSRTLRCCAGVLVAFSVEAMEAAYFHFRFEWHDVWVDSAGVSAGLILLTLWRLFSLSGAVRVSTNNLTD